MNTNISQLSRRILTPEHFSDVIMDIMAEPHFSLDGDGVNTISAYEYLVLCIVTKTMKTLRKPSRGL